MFMGLVPTLQGPCEAALAMQTAATINMTQCRISACHFHYPKHQFKLQSHLQESCSWLFPKLSVQEERVELSTQYCSFSSQLCSSKLQHQSGSKALPAETGKGQMAQWNRAQDPARAHELGAGPGRGAAVRCQLWHGGMDV